MPKRARSGKFGSGGSKRTRRPARSRMRKKSAFRNRRTKTKARAPLVECKKKEVDNTASAIPLTFSDITSSENSVPVEEFTYVPQPWLTMVRGVGNENMIGRDLFLKWLHVKVRLTMPASFDGRFRFRIMHGWIMLPGCEPERNDQGVIIQNTDYLGETRKVMAEEFRKLLEGPDKTKIRMLGDKWYTPRVYKTVDKPSSIVNPIQPIDLHFKWSPMRKVRYDQKLKSATSDIGPYMPDPARGLWVPFYTLWDQSYLSAPAISSSHTKMISRQTMYFTDS